MAAPLKQDLSPAQAGPKQSGAENHKPPLGLRACLCVFLFDAAERKDGEFQQIGPIFAQGWHSQRPAFPAAGATLGSGLCLTTAGFQSCPGAHQSLPSQTAPATPVQPLPLNLTGQPLLPSKGELFTSPTPPSLSLRDGQQLTKYLLRLSANTGRQVGKGDSRGYAQ